MVEKRSLCRFYPNCQKGDRCPFVHSDNNMEPTGQRPARPGGGYGGIGGGGGGGSSYGGGGGAGSYGSGGPGHHGGQRGGGGGPGAGGYGNRFAGERGPYDNKKPSKYPHVCQEFQRGGCSNPTCTSVHQYTFTNDLDLEFSEDIGRTLTSKTQPKIVDICLLDVKEIKEIYAAFLLENLMVIWDLTNRNAIFRKEFEPRDKASTMSFSATDKVLLIGYYSDRFRGHSIVLIRLDDNNSEMFIEPAHEDVITSVSLYNNKIISTSNDKKVKVWCLNPSTGSFTLEKSETLPEPIAKFKIGNMKGNDVFCFCFYGGTVTLATPTQDANGALGFQVLKSWTPHSKAITDIQLFENEALFTSSADSKIFGVTADGKEATLETKGVITTMAVMRNRKNQGVYVTGDSRGYVWIRDFEGKPLGKIILHATRSDVYISKIVGFSKSINDVSYNYFLAGDTLGRFTFWLFQNDRPAQKF